MTEAEKSEVVAHLTDVVTRGAAMGAFLTLHVVLTISQERDEAALRALLALRDAPLETFITMCADESADLIMQGKPEELNMERVAAFSRRAINQLTERGHS